MDAETEERERSSRRRRKSSKAETRQVANKERCAFSLSVDDSRRLSVHAAYLGIDRSELVGKLIREHLRRYIVQDREKGEQEGISAA